ncbi:phosphatidylinositol 5-phosphate 4-kinase type-2 alpha [Sarcoptes scabiei]|nr:phosphatidylinositol 5-phosphate 4-kinase type-2 alpha [Sarcoptes scabiei]
MSNCFEVFSQLSSIDSSKLFCSFKFSSLQENQIELNHLEERAKFNFVIYETNKNEDEIIWKLSPEDINSDLCLLSKLNVIDDNCIELKTSIVDQLVRLKGQKIINQSKINFKTVEKLKIDFENTKKLATNCIGKKIDDRFEITLHLVFDAKIDPETESIFESKKFDRSLLEPINRPNLELLDDWLFCHSSRPIEKPETIQSAIILDRIEQIFFLLDQECDQILLESIDNINDNIYIRLIDRDFFIGNIFFETTEENSSERFESFQQCVDLSNHALIKFEFFLDLDRFEENYDEMKKLLRKLRSSFMIDWYRIERKLFKNLKTILHQNKIAFECLRIFHKNFNDSDFLHKNLTRHDQMIDGNLSFLPAFQVEN